MTKVVVGRKGRFGGGGGKGKESERTEEKNGAGEKRRVHLVFTPRSFSPRYLPDNEKGTGDRADLIKRLNSFSMLITATRCTRVYLNVR